MRIGIDCRLWSESGVGRYVRNLIGQLQTLDHGNEYVLFVRSKDHRNIKFKVHPDKVGTKFKVNVADIRWHTIEEQLQFLSILNREQLDLVHFPYFSVPIFYNKPYVVTIHDLILHHFPTGEASTLPLVFYKLKLLGYKFAIKKAAQNAAKIITVSNATKKEIIDHLGIDRDKIVVTYEGRSVSSKLKAQNSKLQLKTKSYFLYVGNAYPHKNLERLIKSFNLVCHPEASAEGSQILLRQLTDQNDINLVLVGRQDYFYKRLKEKVNKMGLRDLVVFYGEATDEELSALYKNALSLIMPSLMEGFGLPALEAMENKCLVLASDIPAFKEICGDTAIYFDPYNIDDMSEKMVSVLHSNDLYHYTDNIKKGLERSKMFSWEKMARETLRVYESCVGRQPQHQVSP